MKSCILIIFLLFLSNDLKSQIEQEIKITKHLGVLAFDNPYQLGSFSTEYPNIIRDPVFQKTLNKGDFEEIAMTQALVLATNNYYQNTELNIKNNSCIDLEISYKLNFYTKTSTPNEYKTISGSVVIGSNTTKNIIPKSELSNNDKYFKVEFINSKFGPIYNSLRIENNESIRKLINSNQVASCLGFMSVSEFKDDLDTHFNSLKKEREAETARRIADEKNKIARYFINQENAFQRKIKSTSYNDIQKRIYKEYYTSGFYVNPPMSHISSLSKQSNRPLFIVTSGYSDPQKLKLNKDEIEFLSNISILVFGGGGYGSEVLKWLNYKYPASNNLGYGYPGIYIVHTNGYVDGSMVGMGNVTSSIKRIIEATKKNN